MSNPTRDDVKKIAANIESLAREVQNKLDSDGDYLPVSNELVRNNLTFVFTLGEFYALRQVGNTKTVTATTVTNGSAPRNYHNVRDAHGRFARKV